MGVKLKFPKVSRANREAFSLAAENYKKGKYSECYRLISEAATQGVARAYYCKALLELDGNVPEAQGAAAFEKEMKQAAALKYPLAFGALAIYYFEYDKTAELFDFCMKHKKQIEPRFLTLLAATYDGFYTEAAKAENAKLATKTQVLCEAAFVNAFKQKSEEWEENDLYAAFKLTLPHSYAFFNRLLMLSYRYAGVYENRKAYREAYKKAVEYSCDNLFSFGLHRLNAEILMKDIMGLSDLKAVNEAMNALKECYRKMDEELQEANAELYGEIWEQYQDYYEKESERLGSLNIRPATNFQEEFRSKGVGDWLGEIAQGVERWASSPQPKTETYYEINGVKYKKSDNLGYLYDEQGLRSDYRIDDVNRLYGSEDTELGYFSTDNIFMPKK